MGSLSVLKEEVEIMDKELKSKVLQLFLQFIQKYVPLSDAIIASLGGEGREALLWQKAGVGAANGWLIERKKAESRKLISQLPYRYTSSLRNFSHAFRSVSGSNRGVDAFHLDLCGTIEPSVNITRRIIPLVVKSRGRCLAITVADARRNVSVEQFEKIEKWLGALLGFRYNRLRQRLEVEQGKDRELAIMREIGFLFSISDLFRFYGRYAVPDRVRRFAYISHTSGVPFPMRTYFFHFSEKTQRMVEPQFARLLYGQWFREPLQDLNRPRFTGMRTKETTVMNGYPRLKTIAEAAGGEIKKEFDSLLAAVNGQDKLATFLNELSALIQRFSPRSPNVEENRSVKRSHVFRNQENGTSSRRIPHGAIDRIVKNGDKLEIQLQLLRAKAKGKKELQRVQNDLAGKLKLSRRKNRGNIFGGLVARTQGSFRKSFLQRLHAHNPSLINEDLAVVYGRITGKEVTVEQLRSEAGL